MQKETVFKMTGSELKQLREAAGLEQKELAQKMAAFRWTRDTVANYERLKDRIFTVSIAEGEALARLNLCHQQGS